MKNPLRALVVLQLVALALAGCADSDGQPADVTRSSAPVPTVDADTGSIAGLLMDDELVPIPHGRVGLVQAQNQTTAGPDGRFTFNGVVPGKYSLVAEALGYQASSRSVEVLAGAVTYVNFTLAPLQIAPDPYLLVLPKTSYIQAENGFVGQMMESVNAVNLTPVRSLMCSTCLHTLYLDRGPVQAVSENVWAASAVNKEVENRYMWNRTCNSTCDLGVSFQWGRLTNGQQMNWTAANMESLAKNKVTMMVVTITSSQLGASVDHRIQTWTTFAYGQALPEGYSALPKG